MNDAIPIINYGETLAHTLLTIALFYGGVAAYRRVRVALRREALRARIAELRSEHHHSPESRHV